jgi:hypothetical protein
MRRWRSMGCRRTPRWRTACRSASSRRSTLFLSECHRRNYEQYHHYYPLLHRFILQCLFHNASWTIPFLYRHAIPENTALPQKLRIRGFIYVDISSMDETRQSQRKVEFDSNPARKLAARIVQLQIDAADSLQPWGAKTLTEVGPTRNHFHPKAF